MEGPEKPTVRDILRTLGEQYPFDRAAPWDNVGLLAGDERKEVKKVIITVDLTPRVIEAATSSGYDLIISHHPLFIDPLKKVNSTTVEGDMLLKLIGGGCALISAHTNADVSPRGVSRALGERIGLSDMKPIKVAMEEKQYKVVIFVPTGSLDQVMGAAFSSGAGNIGEYSSCSFRVMGTGTFTPSDRATPSTGRKGELNRVEEMRVEVIVDERELAGVLASVKENHPYEEPAIDVYPLAEGRIAGWLGLEGWVEGKSTLGSLLETIREKIDPEIIRYAGELDAVVTRVGLLGGSGGNFVAEVVGSGIDVFITGDLKHHQVHSLVHSGIMAVDIGHYDSEKFVMGCFEAVLNECYKGTISVDKFDESTEYMRVF